MDSWMLSVVIFLPLLGALLLLLVPARQERTLRLIALIASALTFVASLHFWVRWDGAAQDAVDGMRFVQDVTWIRPFVSYHIGLDGISLFLVILTTFLTPLCVLASWTDVTKRVKSFLFCLLVLESAVIGVFSALDLVLFYVFWEAMLIPMYLLIGVWGGKNRIYAAIKFVLYTAVGSVLMLVAIIALYVMTGTFDVSALTQQASTGGLPITPAAQRWMFLAFALAFAIKVPVFPFHTWLPDAHTEAPTVGSVILAGVLLKMGTYGFLRFCLPLFPDAAVHYAPWVCVLAIVGIIYGGLVALAQPDIKKLVAYSSVSHLGFVMLGLFVFNAQGMTGGMLQMINHGLSTGALFLIVGMLYERRHTRQIEDYGGVAEVMPHLFACFMIVTLASIGLPGLNGFIGEILVLAGAIQTNVAYTAFAALGVIIGAVYMLRMFRGVMFGPLENPENKKLVDLRPRELFVMAAIILPIFWIGVYPRPFVRIIRPALERVETVVRDSQHRAPTWAREAGESMVAERN